jgi:hypothetical protein
MHHLYDQYDREFLSFIADKELRIPQDSESGEVLGFHERGWRVRADGRVQWVPATGQGTVVSYVVYHRQYLDAVPVPYTVALIELEEGPRLLARLIKMGQEGPVVGMAVKARFEKGSLVFQPALPQAKRREKAR